MENDTLEVGKNYTVSHSRKGVFQGIFIGRNEEWLDFMVTDGKAKALMPYNEKVTGDTVTVRDSFCVIKPEPPPPVAAGSTGAA